MKKAIFLLVGVILFGLADIGLAEVIELSTTIHKTFREQVFPHRLRSVRLKIITKADYLVGNLESTDFDRARKIHKLLVGEYNKVGWHEDQLAIDDILAKDVELIVDEGLSMNFQQTLRMKAFVYQCSQPMKKYRGGNLGNFLAEEVVAESEYCVSYDNVLEK